MSVPAIHLPIQLQEFSFVLITIILKAVAREWKQKIISNKQFPFIYINLSFDGEKFIAIEDSEFPHDMTLRLGNYRGAAFTTGGQGSNDWWPKSEILNMETMKWSEAPDWPFGV